MDIQQERDVRSEQWRRTIPLSGDQRRREISPVVKGAARECGDEGAKGLDPRRRKGKDPSFARYQREEGDLLPKARDRKDSPWRRDIDLEPLPGRRLDRHRLPGNHRGGRHGRQKSRRGSTFVHEAKRLCLTRWKLL